MTIQQFISHPTIHDTFGPGFTRRIISHLRDVWPQFIGENDHKTFPTFYKPVNSYEAAWALFILSNCTSATRQNVVAAILRGQDMQCDGDNFIVWFGDMLSDPRNLDALKNIFIFADGVSCVHVTPNVDAGYTRTKVFQGREKVSHISRAAILSREFLLEVHDMIGPIKDPEPEWYWGEDNEVYDNEDNLVGIGSGNEVIDITGKVVASIDGYRLKKK